MSFFKSMLSKLSPGHGENAAAAAENLGSDSPDEGSTAVYGYNGAHVDYALSPGAAPPDPTDDLPLTGQPEADVEAELYDFPGEYAQRFDGVDKAGNVNYELNSPIEGSLGVETGQGLDPDTLGEQPAAPDETSSNWMRVSQGHTSGDGAAPGSGDSEDDAGSAGSTPPDDTAPVDSKGFGFVTFADDGAADAPAGGPTGLRSDGELVQGAEQPEDDAKLSGLGDGSPEGAGLRSDGDLVQAVSDAPEPAGDLQSPDAGGPGEPLQEPGSIEFPNLTFHLPDAAAEPDGLQSDGELVQDGETSRGFGFVTLGDDSPATNAPGDPAGGDDLAEAGDGPQFHAPTFGGPIIGTQIGDAIGSPANDGEEDEASTLLNLGRESELAPIVDEPGFDMAALPDEVGSDADDPLDDD